MTNAFLHLPLRGPSLTCFSSFLPPSHSIRTSMSFVFRAMRSVGRRLLAHKALPPAAAAARVRFFSSTAARTRARAPLSFGLGFTLCALKTIESDQALTTLTQNSPVRPVQRSACAVRCSLDFCLRKYQGQGVLIAFVQRTCKPVPFTFPAPSPSPSAPFSSTFGFLWQCIDLLPVLEQLSAANPAVQFVKVDVTHAPQSTADASTLLSNFSLNVSFCSSPSKSLSPALCRGAVHAAPAAHTQQ
jgi:hypothetical protein